MSNKDKNVIIIGGGLVGSLEALFCAQRSYNVNVYESRPDPRKEKYVARRSINLALSERGRAALREVGAENEVVKACIPMYARMLHSHSGECTPMPYGKKGQCILSVDRKKLNEHLITLADKNPNIKYHFESKFVSGNFNEGQVTLSSKNGENFDKKGDLIIGCDGSYSGVRRQLMKFTRINYSQFYISHGYKEIQMLPDMNGDFAMEINYLHVWPRNEFMMLGLPNQDKSFTLTLFMPFDMFLSIKTDDDIMNFFQREFPDSIPLIGKEKLINDYNSNPVGELISIKTSPYHYSDKVVIIGDAAHAMVPFYGQGMNSGFEDCSVLHEILDKTVDMKTGLEEYSRFRNADAEAIIDLALYNYMEMRSHVNSPLFALRKKFDGFVNWLFPSYWIPLYTMVAFTRIPYHQVINKSKKQDLLLQKLKKYTALGVTTFSLFLIYQEFKTRGIQFPKYAFHT